jgi:tetratricopeptide (TPR) repeat protein
MHEPAAMPLPPFRRPSPAARVARLCGRTGLGCLVAFVLATAPVTAQTQPAEDDPFADELNPFGRGTESKPAEPPSSIRLTAPAAAPRDGDREEPVKSDPADEDPAARKPTKPKRESTERPTDSRTQTRLPVPFPESEEPEDRDRRDRGRGSRDDDRGEAWEPTEAEEMLAEAEKLDRAGRLDEARAKLLQVIELDPKMTLAYLALGVTARRLGDFEGSVDACSKGLEIDPEDAELYLRRGIAWFHMGLYGIALEDFEDAAGLAYDDPRPELWRGLTLVELDRPLEAINAYAASIRRDRTFMLAYLNRGLAYLVTDQPRKAESDFNQAIRHDPRDARAWFNRGVSQTRQGRFREAAHSYSEALKRDPKLEAARQNAAAVKARAGEERRP